MNILMIVADDQGPHLSFLNTPGIKTPHLDALCNRGQYFAKAYAASASCAPNRGALMTGMYTHSNGHWRNTITPTIHAPASDFGRESTMVDKVGTHEDIPTLSEVLNAAGYETAISQKFHLSPPWKHPFKHRIPTPYTPASAHGESIQSWLQGIGDKPFFLTAAVCNTHRPYPKHFEEEHAVDPDALELPPFLPDVPEVRQDYAEYMSTVQAFDRAVGGVLQALEAEGKLADTLVIYTSDHGFPYHRAKATVYDAGAHVPLAIAGPGVVSRGGRVSRQLVSHIDLMPTILEALDLPVPDNVQGRSLWPWLRGDTEEPVRDAVFFEHNAHGPGEEYPSRAVTNGRFHYIRNLDPTMAYIPPADLDTMKGWVNRVWSAIEEAKDTHPLQYELREKLFDRPAEELFDLESDPHELHNLVEDGRYSAPLEELRGKLEAWMKETADPGDMRKTQRRFS